MNYFTSKLVVTPTTTLSLRGFEEDKILLYHTDNNIQYWAVDTTLTIADFISRQYVECAVQEVTYEQIREQIEEGHIYKDVKRIKEQYGVDLSERFGVRL